MARPKAPCMNCQFREPGCHGKCESYKEFKDERLEFSRGAYKDKVAHLPLANAVLWSEGRRRAWRKSKKKR